MAKILSKERVVEYSLEFKTKVVELTQKLDVETVDIAEALGLHPIMLYRWRQEYREGKFVAPPTRRISMTKRATTPSEEKAQVKELKRLQKEVAALKKENDFLKKWQEYLKAQRRNGSDT